MQEREYPMWIFSHFQDIHTNGWDNRRSPDITPKTVTSYDAGVLPKINDLSISCCILNRDRYCIYRLFITHILYRSRTALFFNPTAEFIRIEKEVGEVYITIEDTTADRKIVDFGKN